MFRNLDKQVNTHKQRMVQPRNPSINWLERFELSEASFVWYLINGHKRQQSLLQWQIVWTAFIGFHAETNQNQKLKDLRVLLVS